MKKLLIFLFTMVLLLSITGCGEQNANNNNKGTNNNTSQKENNNPLNDDDEDNASYDDKKVVVEKIINCDGCVFAYFNKEGNEAVRLGDTISANEYTKDINNLKTKGGKQRHNFFGLVLSGNTISRAYACILKDNKIYCIEGSVNGAYHNSNIAILNKIFTSGQCRTISDGHTYTCTDGNYNGDT
ncbi:MAG: hypothetical protein J6X02_01445, partial [Bacilli bacterium]|nr:hypothetical protein [Bacilli bacterium]